MPSTSEGPTEPEAWGIMDSLWLLSLSVLDESAPALEAMGLSPKTFFLLSAVERSPFPAELARVMHLPPPTVTYMLKQLESIGYIERRAEPGDLRKFRLILTEAGHQTIARAREATSSVLAIRLKRLANHEIQTFEKLAERLARPASE